MGHSWVKDIEEEHLRNPISEYDLEFAYEEGVRISGLIDMIPRVMATYHTHILLFSVLPDALSLYSIDSQNPMTSQYKVLGPNKEFNPEYFAHQMNIFTEHCKVINPKVKIILMIPPVTDLVYHNHIRVSYYPFMLQNAYQANPQYDERLLYTCMKDLYSSIMLLKTQFTWMEKLVYPLQVVAQSINIIRNPLGRFMKGDIYSLGETSHLRDGFHPNPMFIEKMWWKLKMTGLLNLDGASSSSVFNRLQPGPLNNNTSPVSPSKNKANTAPLKGILKKKKLGSSPSVTSSKTDSPSSTTSVNKKEPISPTVSILKRPVDAKTQNSNSELNKKESSISTVNVEEPMSPEIEVLNGKIASHNEANDFISLKTTSAIQSTSKPGQLVNASYISQEIEKFASFMAGHAHAVGQNLSLKEIKQMMADVLKEQL